MSIINGFSNIPNNIANAIDRYNIPIVEEKIIESSTYTTDLFSGLSYVDWKNCKSDMLEATASSCYSDSSAYRLNNAFNSDASTSWSSVSAALSNVTIKFKDRIKIIKLNIRVGSSEPTYFMKAAVQGSNDYETWDTLYSTSTVQTERTQITLNNPYYYFYYRIIWTHSSSARSLLYDLHTVEWEQADINFHLNLNLPLFSYEADKIVNIGHTSYGQITSFKNSYLNINNLGAKQINGTIGAGQKYSLVYNGESWDILSNNIEVVTGTYTGTGTYGSGSRSSLTFDFIPSLIEIQDTSIAATNGTTGSAIILYPKELFGISEYLSGNSSKRFKAYVDTSGTTVSWYTTESNMPSIQCNASSKVYRYWAYR